MRLVALFIVLLSATGVFAQTNLYVDASVVATGNGQSWSSAYKSLSEALKRVDTGSISTKYVIHIARGVYYPTGIQSSPNRDSSFAIRRGGISLLGGYPPGGSATRSPNNLPPILSGDIGVPGASSDNSFHVLTLAGIGGSTDTILLDQLEVTKGCANGPASKTYNGVSFRQDCGGAALIKNNICKLLLRNCQFTLSKATGNGGGIYNENSSTQFTTCRIEYDSSSGSGGGLYNVTTSNTTGVVFDDGYVNYNVSIAGSGGGIYNIRSSGTGPGTIFKRLRFWNNRAYNSNGNGFGGGAYDSSVNVPSTSFYDCEFDGNYANYGGGVAAINMSTSSSSAYMQAISFTGNVASLAGGGMYNVASNCNYTLDTVGFGWCRAANFGGGLYTVNRGSSVGSMTQCSFYLDSASFGGGVYDSGQSNTSNCQFINNIARISGGGIYKLRAANSSIKKSLIQGNISHGSGAGVYMVGADSNLILSNLLFSSNKAVLYGAGIYDSSSSPTIIHCTFGSDSATVGNAITNASNSSPVITNTVLWDGEITMFNDFGSHATVSYSTIPGGYPGNGNLGTNPIFMAPKSRSLAPTYGGDYTVIACSPAIDAGNNSGSYLGLKDLAGHPRLYNSNVDQGAYEYQGGPFSPMILTFADSTCQNRTNLQYTSNTSLGLWASSDTSVAKIDSVGFVTPGSPGITSISYSIAAGNCSSVLSRTLKILPIPIIGPITGPDSVCANDTTHLFVTTSGATSINWMSLNQYVAFANNNSGFITTLSAGVAPIRVTASNGNCYVSREHQLVALYPKTPAITGKTSLCLGDTATLLVDLKSKRWYSTDTSVVVIDSNGWLQSRKPGKSVITAVGKSSLGCLVYPLTSISVDTINTTVYIQNSDLVAADSGANYSWLDCDSNYRTIIQHGRVYSPAGNGRFAVEIRRGGCVDTSACIAITGLNIPTSSVEAKVYVYPNPASGDVTIRAARDLPDYIRLKDISGRILYQTIPESLITVVRLIELANGIYTIDVSISGTQQTTRIGVIR